jgi:protoporphyrinogen oxidase
MERKLNWIVLERKMYPFTTALQMLAFPPLSFLEKIKMGLAGIYLQKTKKWKKFEKITAVEWAIKNFGDKAYEVVWEPLLKGKFHQFHDKVSMAWLWARIHTRGNSKDRDGKERLGYFDGGF